jgi:hypothetical protein
MPTKPCPKYTAQATQGVALQKSEEITVALLNTEFKTWINDPIAGVSKFKKEVLASVIAYIDKNEASTFRKWLTDKSRYTTCLEIFSKADLIDILFLQHVVNILESIGSNWTINLNSANAGNSSLRNTTLPIAKKHLATLMVPFVNEIQNSILGLGVTATTGSYYSFNSILPVAATFTLAYFLSGILAEQRLQNMLTQRLVALELIHSGTKEEIYTLMLAPVHDSLSDFTGPLSNIAQTGCRLAIGFFNQVNTKLQLVAARMEQNTLQPAYNAAVTNADGSDKIISQQQHNGLR